MQQQQQQQYYHVMSADPNGGMVGDGLTHQGYTPPQNDGMQRNGNGDVDSKVAMLAGQLDDATLLRLLQQRAATSGSLLGSGLPSFNMPGSNMISPQPSSTISGGQVSSGDMGGMNPPMPVDQQWSSPVPPSMDPHQQQHQQQQAEQQWQPQQPPSGNSQPMARNNSMQQAMGPGDAQGYGSSPVPTQSQSMGGNPANNSYAQPPSFNSGMQASNGPMPSYPSSMPNSDSRGSFGRPAPGPSTTTGLMMKVPQFRQQPVVSEEGRKDRTEPRTNGHKRMIMG